MRKSKFKVEMLNGRVEVELFAERFSKAEVLQILNLVGQLQKIRKTMSELRGGGAFGRGEDQGDHGEA